jgi:methionyl-tRNA formyltransferase
MKRFLFFAYRDWAINIFKNINSSENEFILMNNKNLCNMEFLDSLKPDMIFFYGWSWIIEEDIINKYDCMCLHPSKLPKYRGGTPIQNQIIGGEKESAVTIFKMSKGIDDGPIYYQEDFNLDGYLENIFKKIETIGTIGTKKLLKDVEKGNVVLTEQNHIDATFCKRLKPSNSEIKGEDFTNFDAEYFYNKVRSLQKPYPECYIKCKTGKIIIKNIDYEEL